MHGIKALFSTTALFAGLALAPVLQAQVIINVGVQPSCAYGYYDYQPYACAPMGFYGPGYFYNGIFLGMGPWAGWGYGHGWGSHRFERDGGGSYRGGGGLAANRAYAGGHSGGRSDGGGPARMSNGGGAARTTNGGGARVNSTGSSHFSTSNGGRASQGTYHSGGARPSASHSATAHPAQHAASAPRGGGQVHSSGGQAHGGEAHGGGEKH
jgi:hypothetical protein